MAEKSNDSGFVDILLKTIQAGEMRIYGTLAKIFEVVSQQKYPNWETAFMALSKIFADIEQRTAKELKENK